MKKIVLVLALAFLTITAFPQWTHVSCPTEQDLVNIKFVDSLTGFISGMDVILKTTDGGNTWFEVYTGYYGSAIMDMSFPTATVGYAGGDFILLKTTDGGDTWNPLPLPTSSILRGVYFKDVYTGFLCCQGEEIWRTDDGGFGWVLQTEGAYWLRKFSFPTQQVGYCVGDGHSVYKTNNGGLDWSYMTGYAFPNLTDVQFLDMDTGFICGYSGYVAMTDDGGNSWQELNAPTESYLEGIYALDKQQVYVVGWDGLILHTADAGATWTTDVSGSNAFLRKIIFLESGLAYVVGHEGTILVSDICTKADFSASIDSLIVSFTNESECADIYWWDFGDGYYSDHQTPWHAYDSIGQYTVCLTVTDTVTYFSDTYCEVLLITSLNNADPGQLLTIFPNPCYTSLTIKTAGNISVSAVEMYDMRGTRVLRREMMMGGNQETTLDLDLPPGLYMLVGTIGGEKRFMKKIMVKQ